jgi:transcriptional regulator with XRE-family HTH domain
MTSNPNSRLGILLRQARKTRGLTLEVLAETVGLTPGALSHIESGRRLPDPKNAVRIAEALGLPVDDVLQALDAEHASRRRSQAYERSPQADHSFLVARTSTGPAPGAAADAVEFRPMPIEALRDVVPQHEPEPSRHSDARHAARWSDDRQTRIAAIESLADQAAEGIRTLRGLIDDEDIAVAKAARRLLRELDVRLPEK